MVEITKVAENTYQANYTKSEIETAYNSSRLVIAQYINTVSQEKYFFYIQGITTDSAIFYLPVITNTESYKVKILINDSGNVTYKKVPYTEILKVTFHATDSEMLSDTTFEKVQQAIDNGAYVYGVIDNIGAKLEVMHYTALDSIMFVHVGYVEAGQIFVLLLDKTNTVNTKGGSILRVEDSTISDNVTWSSAYISQYINSCLSFQIILQGTTAPTINTKGVVGQYYRNTSNNTIYQCLGQNNDNTFSWIKMVQSTDEMTPTSVFKMAGGSFGNIDTIDHRYFVIDTADHNILKYYHPTLKQWTPITSVWS